jgi:hypothetical protein
VATVADEYTYDPYRWADEMPQWIDGIPPDAFRQVPRGLIEEFPVVPYACTDVDCDNSDCEFYIGADMLNSPPFRAYRWRPGQDPVVRFGPSRVWRDATGDTWDEVDGRCSMRGRGEGVVCDRWPLVDVERVWGPLELIGGAR